jgi:2-isopropylmalate synthase
MARWIEILDTTLRDGNKLPFVVLSPEDRVLLARRLARLRIDIIEAGFPASAPLESECVSRIAREIKGSWIGALARAIPQDVEAAVHALQGAEKPYIHVFMPVSAHALSSVVKMDEGQAVAAVRESVRVAAETGVRTQFTLSQAPQARAEFRDQLVRAARDAGAEVISFADTAGTLLPEDIQGVVRSSLSLFPEGRAPVIGVHCHNDMVLASANTFAAVQAGAGHVEVTLGGFGERAGNAALEEVAFLIAAHGERLGISQNIALEEISASSRLLDEITGVHTHPNKPIIGRAALGRRGLPELDPLFRNLLQEKTIGARAGAEPSISEEEGPFSLESFNVMSSSHAPSVGIVVITRGETRITQSAHGTGPIDSLFKAVDRALGFSPKLVYFSLYALAAGHDAPAEVTVTTELKGVRFHGRHQSKDVVEAGLRAYMKACNAIGKSGIVSGGSDFYVQGEYLWE